MSVKKSTGFGLYSPTPMPDHECRISKLEANHENANDHFKKHVEVEEKMMTFLIEKLDNIENQMARQKGFYAGVVFAITSLIGIAGFLLQYFWGNR